MFKPKMYLVILLCLLCLVFGLGLARFIQHTQSQPVFTYQIPSVFLKYFFQGNDYDSIEASQELKNFSGLLSANGVLIVGMVQKDNVPLPSDEDISRVITKAFDLSPTYSVMTRPMEYTFTELANAYWRMMFLFSKQGLVAYGIDEGKNRIYLGVENAEFEEEVQGYLKRFSIPPEMIIFEVTGPVRLL